MFYESWALLPALETLAIDGQISVLLVWADASHSVLTGLIPLAHERTYQKCPATHWTNWLHLHCPLGTPLVHRDHAESTLEALLGWLDEESGAMVFSLSKIPSDGAFARSLQAVTQSQGRMLDDRDHWERALLQGGVSGEEYVTTHHSKKKLKEYSRLRRRLEDLGELEFQTLRPGKNGNLHQWTRDFLKLEGNGWKGRALTAMSCNGGERLFAESLIHNAAERGQLMMLRMSLDGEPIAVKLNFISATEGAFALKIAYDEQFAPFSPGVLLELENIYTMLDETHVGWMDSCAIPNHPMIDRLWAGRRPMVNYHISTRQALSKPLLHTMHLLKTAYHYYKGIRL
ncbi:MAG: GNAT family N-acetyltransferase [Gammaproteobacteria bacterium]|nr:GNAT family N-acetyltransferase [Gammaproteobacteria bacterium]MBU1725810.1 GNAT family N-acetyltransferase [Gammaproteobacteria bacterium]MBU2007313.1 GNAT family N-acetyltransferase [Gammaproteobacteria bacterium]